MCSFFRLSCRTSTFHLTSSFSFSFSSRFLPGRLLERLASDCALNFGVELAAGQLPDEALWALQRNSETACEAAQHATGYYGAEHQEPVQDWLPASLDVRGVDLGDGGGPVSRLRVMNRAMYDELPEADADAGACVLLRLVDGGAAQRVEVEKRNPGSLVVVKLAESGEFLDTYVRAHACWDGCEHTLERDTSDESGSVELETLRRDSTSIPSYLRLLGALASSHEAAYLVMHHLKCSLTSTVLWMGADWMFTPPPREDSSEDVRVESMWSMLGLWILQLDRVLASARPTASPALETNAFIEGAFVVHFFVCSILVSFAHYSFVCASFFCSSKPPPLRCSSSRTCCASRSTRRP